MEIMDLQKVASLIEQDTNKVIFAENAHHFTKVAFDVFRMNNSPTDSYWILEKDEDGTEYLVATYDSEDDTLKAEASLNLWEAIADKSNQNITLLYKQTPIKRLASSDYGFNTDDAGLFQHTLVNKMNTDQAFVKSFIESQDENRKQEIINKFPELAIV